MDFVTLQHKKRHLKTNHSRPEMTETMPYHTPALLHEAVDALNIKTDGTYVDATLGGGGHSRAIVERLGPQGMLYAMDQDMDAVSRAFTHPSFTVIHGNFRYLRNFMRFHEVDHVDGILADLGVSFHHFDSADRGFSFRTDAPADMRMNRDGSLTAAEILNTYSTEHLAEILSLYGEVDNAPRVARAITKARETSPIATTGDLLTAVSPLLNPRREKKDLACIFQALRIEVNDEMGALRDFLNATLTVTSPGARLAIITYHSLEDRMVKNFMRSGNIEGRVETDFYGRRLSPWRPLTSKPVVPSASEIEINPRSRSAKLRVAERI